MNGRAQVLAEVRRQVVDICLRGLDTGTFRIRVLQAIQRAVPVDAVWFATADPHTLLFTGGISDPEILPAAPMFMRNELMGNDVNKFFQLAQAHPPVSSLFAATDGKMESSPRYRDILEPLHLGDELRVTLVGGRLCWGYLCPPSGGAVAPIQRPGCRLHGPPLTGACRWSPGEPQRA